MAGKATRRQGDRSASGKSASGGPVKVTLRLTEMTAKRLGVQAVMTGESQSDIAERVLSAYLAGWRLPSNLSVSPPLTADGADGVEDAA